MRKQIDEILADPSVLDHAPHPIIYHSLLGISDPKDDSQPTSTRLVAQPISSQDLTEEAFILLFAGTDSSSTVLATGIINALEKPRVYESMKKELKDVWPSLKTKPKLEELEKLPYLVRSNPHALIVMTSHNLYIESVHQGIPESCPWCNPPFEQGGSSRWCNN